MTDGATLGVDFGTSHTVAAVARADPRRPVELLLFDASPLLPSGVHVEDGRVLVGRDAQRAARLDPSAYEPNPKRRIDDGTLLLGGAELAVSDAIAAVLRRAGAEASRTLGGTTPSGLILTHPAGWGVHRRQLLIDAAAAAGLPMPRLVPEPVAAAVAFTTVLGHRIDVGSAVVVYDFGGGTFDISVVRRTGRDTWDVVAADGLDDVGGVDLDAAVVDWVGTQVAARDPALWRRLGSPATALDRRHRATLWEDARAVKEQLARVSRAGLNVPLFDVDLHLTREELETLVRPWLERTVTLTTATLFTSGVTADRLAGVFLVGGSSRLPLVATLLHRALGVAPVVLEQPELVVANGSVHTTGIVPPTPTPAVTPPLPPDRTVLVAADPQPAPAPAPVAAPAPPPVPNPGFASALASVFASVLASSRPAGPGRTRPIAHPALLIAVGAVLFLTIVQMAQLRTLYADLPARGGGTREYEITAQGVAYAAALPVLALIAAALAARVRAWVWTAVLIATAAGLVLLVRASTFAVGGNDLFGWLRRFTDAPGSAVLGDVLRLLLGAAPLVWYAVRGAGREAPQRHRRTLLVTAIAAVLLAVISTAALLLEPGNPAVVTFSTFVPIDDAVTPESGRLTYDSMLGLGTLQWPGDDIGPQPWQISWILALITGAAAVRLAVRAQRTMWAAVTGGGLIASVVLAVLADGTYPPGRQAVLPLLLLAITMLAAIPALRYAQRHLTEDSA